MLKAKGVSDEQIDMFLKMMEKDPDLFQKIALEIKAKVDSGMNEMEAGREVMQKYEKELKNLV
jgi:hypothetical protein